MAWFSMTKFNSVELIYAGQEVAVTETSTSFYNERQKVEIDLTKSLEVDEDYGVGNNGEIFDVSFGLYAAEELTAADGTTIPADGLIEVITLMRMDTERQSATCRWAAIMYRKSIPMRPI